MMQSAALGALAGAARSWEPSPLPPWSAGLPLRLRGGNLTPCKKQDWVWGCVLLFRRKEGEPCGFGWVNGVEEAASKVGEGGASPATDLLAPCPRASRFTLDPLPLPL